MIAGLDEAAKRAEALAAREEAKRKSGGKSLAAEWAEHKRAERALEEK